MTPSNESASKSIHWKCPRSHLDPIGIHWSDELHHLQIIPEFKEVVKTFLSQQAVIFFHGILCSHTLCRLCRLERQCQHWKCFPHLSLHDTQLSQTRRPEAVPDQHLKSILGATLTNDKFGHWRYDNKQEAMTQPCPLRTLAWEQCKRRGKCLSFRSPEKKRVLDQKLQENGFARNRFWMKTDNIFITDWSSWNAAHLPSRPVVVNSAGHTNLPLRYFSKEYLLAMQFFYTNVNKMAQMQENSNRNVARRVDERSHQLAGL